MSKDARRKEKEATKAEPKVEVKTEPKVEAKAEPKVKAEPKAKRMTVADLTDICRTLAEATKECKEDLRDHEDRILKLEKEGFGEPEPVSEPEPTPEPTPKPEPEAEPKIEIRPVGGACCKNGAGYAFKFWQAATRTWGLTSDVWAAKQISNGVYDPIWVWYENGQIDHILSDDEIKKFVP